MRASASAPSMSSTITPPCSVRAATTGPAPSCGLTDGSGAPTSAPEGRQFACVVAQDLALGVVVELREVGDVVERLRHALDVGPVGAEDHARRSHQGDDLVHVVLPEGIDPDVP